MDGQAFAAACEAAAGRERAAGGIGTLGEKTLHAALKLYYEPDCTRHEVPIAGYVADILRPEGIVEIQTAGFDKLRAKLAAFLPSWPVTVVYPVAQTRHLRWVDPDTGEVTAGRRGARKGGVYDIVPELYKLRPLLPNENLTLCVALLELEEYKYLNGYGKTRKIRARRMERVPLALHGEIYMGGEYGWGALLPDGLAGRFTSAEYAAQAKIGRGMAGTTLGILHTAGAVERAGKQGNAYVYQTCGL